MCTTTAIVDCGDIYLEKGECDVADTIVLIVLYCFWPFVSFKNFCV